MVELWFGLLCFMLTVFVVLDGWNIGAGALHLIAARPPPSAARSLRPSGPPGAGTRSGSWRSAERSCSRSRKSWPRRSPGSTSRSGSCSGRSSCAVSPSRSAAISTTGSGNRGGISSSPCRACVLAVLFGAALGNVIRGVPLDESGKFSMSLFTDFGVRGRVGILDWYTVSVAVFTTVLLSAHGATYLRLKTIGQVHERSERLARWLWTAATRAVCGRLAGNLGRATGAVRGDDRAASGLACDRGCRGWSLGARHRVARNSGESRLCGIVRGDRGPPGRRRGQRVSSDAALDAGVPSTR